MKRIVVIGEALIDVIRTPEGTVELPGGSPANVAISLARLGRSPELITSFANDVRGAALADWLDASGVNYKAQIPAAGRTSSAYVTLDQDGVPQYNFDLGWDLSQEAALGSLAVENLGVLHTGSIATLLQPGAAAVKAALREARGRALITFDPNARSSITPGVAAARAEVERFVTLSDVVKVSEEDLAWYYPGMDPVDAACQWAAAGPVLVVVTLGAEGSVLVRAQRAETTISPSDDESRTDNSPSDEESLTDKSTSVEEPRMRRLETTAPPTIIRVPGQKVPVADTIGAGDTYMGGLIDALLYLRATGPEARERLENLTVTELGQAANWATSAAAITVSRKGHNPPTLEELQNLGAVTPRS